MMSRLPGHITKYFWGDDLSELSWDKHAKYLTETILNHGDIKALAWLFERTEKKQLKNHLDTYRLNPKSANFWKIYLK